MAPESRRKHAILISCPRTRSNLTFRWICTSPDVYPIHYPFISASRSIRKENSVFYHLHHSQERQQELDATRHSDATIEDCANSVPKEILEAEKSSQVAVIFEQWEKLVKVDHAVGVCRGQACDFGANPTNLDSDVLSSLLPVFVIRQPAAVVDSCYRAIVAGKRKMRPGDEDFKLMTRNRAHRLLFDYFTAQGVSPIVIDSWDIIKRTDNIARKLEYALGIKGMTDKWVPGAAEKIIARFPETRSDLDQFNSSSGICRPGTILAAEADVSTFYYQWQEKYGETVATQLRELAEDNVPDYHYLLHFKL